MKLFFFIAWIFLASRILIAQNLVPNPSFEELIRCPHSFSTDRKDFMVPGWTSPTKGTPDLFHSCSWGEADVPYNWAGSSNAHTGKGYAGIYVWRIPDDSFKKEGNEENNYREYVQCELAEPLQAGKRYKVEFYYKLSSHSVYATNRIGLLLINTPIYVEHDQVLQVTPTISVENDTLLSASSSRWEWAQLDYTAQGGEQYLVIGNFFDNKSTKNVRLPYRIGKNSMLVTSAYFYIDDVSVTPLDPPSLPGTSAKQEFNLEHIQLNHDYILKNIQFEFDSYTLLRSSFVELDQVATYLNANANIDVRLAGHTDFLGSDDYNLILSRNRARSVADYLISKGVKPDRINTYGYGKTRPILLERTDEARSINRRVEIRFVEGMPDKF